MTSSSSSAPHLHITTNNNDHPSSTVTSLSHSHHHQQPSARPPPPRSSSGSPRGGGAGVGAGGGTTNQACAACKYQRRKCNPDCPLAPYFPADHQRRFLNAHRLFGVSNILKTLRRIKPELRDEAMRTLVYQAEMRAHDPVGGCCRVILELERQLEIETAELSAVLHHLALCRQAAAAGNVDMDGAPCAADLDVASSNQQALLLNAKHDVVDALYSSNQEANAGMLQADHHDQEHSPHDHGGEQQQQLYDYFYYETTTGDDASSKPSVDINVDAMEHFDYDTSCPADHKVDDLAPAPAPAVPSGLGQQLEEHSQIDQKEYEMKVASLVDVFDIRQELQALDVNAEVDVKEELQEEVDAKNSFAVGEAAQMAESSQCKLGLGFSSF